MVYIAPDVALTPNSSKQMSLGTFTDNVINLAIESCLLCDIPKILTTTEVGEMNEGKLNELASESEDDQAQRQMLQAQVGILRSGLQECDKHRRREFMGTSELSTRMFASFHN